MNFKNGNKTFLKTTFSRLLESSCTLFNIQLLHALRKCRCPISTLVAAAPKLRCPSAIIVSLNKQIQSQKSFFTSIKDKYVATN